MMDVKVEIGDPVELEQADEQAKAEIALYTPEQMMVDALKSQPTEEVRTKVPTLDDVMSEEELSAVTAEGLQANPEQTEAQTKEAMEKAAQQEAWLNYRKQQFFMQYMAMRPIPATMRNVDWALVRYELIIHDKKEFDSNPSIERLTEQQWYHGILTGNVHVSRNEDNQVLVSLVVPYRGASLALAYTEEQLAAQRLRAKAQLPRKQRREQERANSAAQ